MKKIDAETRRYAAVLGRRHFQGSVTLDALFQHFGSSEDPLIRALLEAAAYQPRRGFFGISERQWQRDFLRPVSVLLDELEKGLEGRAPAIRVYPRSGFGGILGWTAFTLFAGVCAAEHAVNLWKLNGSAAVSLESVGLAMTGLATWAGFRCVLFRVHLYRTRKDPYGGDGHGAG